MNILILAAGDGRRFSSCGYKLPKPLIDVNGMPMIVRAVNTLGIDGNYFFLIRQDQYTPELISCIASAKKNVTILTVNKTTEGAAASALLFERFIDNSEELIITNCDQIMNWDARTALLHLSNYDGGVVTVTSQDPKHSYVELENDIAVKFAEKQVISNHALTGIHYWKHGSDFVSSAKEMINCNDRAPNGEFYIAPTYNYMLKNKKRIGTVKISDKEFWPVGTPADLERYLNACK